MLSRAIEKDRGDLKCIIASETRRSRRGIFNLTYLIVTTRNEVTWQSLKINYTWHCERSAAISYRKKEREMLRRLVFRDKSKDEYISRSILLLYIFVQPS